MLENPLSGTTKGWLTAGLIAGVAGIGYFLYKNQAPAAAPVTPTVTVTPGNQTASAKGAGAVLVALPTGGTWVSQGGQALSGSTPIPVYVVSSQGSQTTFVWTDSTGAQQTTNLTISLN